MTSRMAGRILVTALLLSPLAARAEPDDGFPFLEATVAQLQAEMAAGRLTSEQLTRAYIERIHALDSSGPGVNSIMELNPDALAMARKADEQRRGGTVLGPLHGIPVLLKDNIDTGDRMQTSAGSFALVGTPAVHDSTVAANLRAGGAVILGKTTLSEWANFRSFESISGWSGRGGQTHNPYGIDRNACGSSSGSGAAASANFATVSLGSETDGSIVCPGNANGVVGLKPTVGLTSRAGVVPISHTQDTIGPLTRTVADAAATLSVIQSRTYDGRDPATGSVMPWLLILSNRSSARNFSIAIFPANFFDMSQSLTLVSVIQKAICIGNAKLPGQRTQRMVSTTRNWLGILYFARRSVSSRLTRSITSSCWRPACPFVSFQSL